MLFLEDLSNLTSQIGDMSGIGTIFAWLLAFFVIIMVILIIVYIYSSLTLMIVAKRTKTENAWMAWIPYLSSYLMSKIAKKHWWPVFLLIIVLIIPLITSILGLSDNIIISIISIIIWIVFYIFTIIWTYNICKMRKRPGWWAVLTIIPIVGWIWGFIMWGILAWGK